MAGIAIAGGGTIAYTIREFLTSAFASLQSGTVDPVSFEELVSIAKAIHLRITKDAAPKIDTGAICTILLSGYCQDSKRLRAFVLKGESDNGVATVNESEVLQESEVPYWFGSGRSAAEKVITEGVEHPMDVLHEVIHRNMHETVGGGLQYGIFEDNNFRVYGVEDYRVDKNGQVHPRASLRGFELDGRSSSFNITLGRFLINHPWRAPFAERIDQLNLEFNRRVESGEIPWEDLIAPDEDSRE